MALWKTSPIIPWADSTRADYHFPSSTRRAQFFANAVATGSIDDLGVYLHIEQDSYSHAGFGPWLGHGLNTEWDKTYAHPDVAYRMAERSYNQMVSFRGSRRDSTTTLGFGQISSLVKDFINAKTDKEKKQIIQQLVAMIEKEMVIQSQMPMNKKKKDEDPEKQKEPWR